MLLKLKTIQLCFSWATKRTKGLQLCVISIYLIFSDHWHVTGVDSVHQVLTVLYSFFDFLMLVIPMCFSNTCKAKNISQNAAVYYIKYNSRATCFDSLLSHLQARKEQIQSNQSL